MPSWECHELQGCTIVGFSKRNMRTVAPASRGVPWLFVGGGACRERSRQEFRSEIPGELRGYPLPSPGDSEGDLPGDLPGTCMLSPLDLETSKKQA